jgi:alpha-ketoglutarate-dependent taurine dioxygenase
MSFEAFDLTPCIGAEIRTDTAALLSGKYAKEIRTLLEQRAVLVFPKANLTDEQQIAFSKTIGNYALEDGYFGNGGATYRVSLDPRESERASSLKSSFRWHLDGTTADVPTYASILSARRVAAVGGQTEFCNTYAAYQGLSDADKALIEDLFVHHSGWAIQLGMSLETTYEQYLRLRTRGADLPMVWRHRDGRKSLVVGSSAEYVIGMTPQDGMGLLIRLCEWATSPQFVYRHEWSVGDIVVWDNTGTMHRALPYAEDSGRLMIKTRLAGEETFLGKAVELEPA